MFDEVVGIDYSKAFVNKCEEMKTNGRIMYEMVVEGDLCVDMEAIVDPDVVRYLYNNYNVYLTFEVKKVHLSIFHYDI